MEAVFGLKAGLVLIARDDVGVKAGILGAEKDEQAEGISERETSLSRF